jgi:quercetin dioxygenase-like cupin family protein
VAEDQVVPFPTVDWHDDVPGIRGRAEVLDGARWGVVEYEPGAWREEWCEDGHRGYVLEGAIEYDFEDGSGPLALSRGQGFVLAAGTGHRGRNPTGTVTRLFLIDD